MIFESDLRNLIDSLKKILFAILHFKWNPLSVVLRCAHFTLTNTGATFKHFHYLFYTFLCNYEEH